MRPEGFYCTPQPITREQFYKAGRIGDFQAMSAFKEYPGRETNPEDTAINDAMWRLHLLNNLVVVSAEGILKDAGLTDYDILAHLKLSYE